MFRLFIILFVGIVVGYVAEVSLTKNNTAEGFRRGEVSFCELDENERFKVCPSVRVLKTPKGGGTITEYYCSKNEMYLVIHGISEEVKEQLMLKFLQVKMKGHHVKPSCGSDNNKAFRLSKELEA